METKILFLLRVIAVNRPNQPPIEVSQLQTVKWADLSAPDDTKILRDLVHKAADLNPSKDPVLVHCSAGVGRTGTFIGLYKLVNDYNDDTVESNIESLTNSMSAIPQVDKLDPFETVVTMRRQRNKMVQKPMQYNYMFRCLADYVAETNTEYV